MIEIQWQKLLSTTRVRDLFREAKSRKVPSDFRSEFERDYGRAIFSTPVRRLQDKAQVFPLEAHDAVRTRLTHSLEVSSVARNMAQEVGSWLFQMGHLKQDDVGALSTIAATCGLIHDIGNPPFGHAGELAIQSWFEKKCPNSAQGQSEFFQADVTSQLAQDFLRFNGNPHMLRLVACLQVLADYRGMNLTCGTLSAACKYLAPSNALTKEVHERSRTGFFLSEEDLVQRIRAETGTGEARNPITYLVEASDDIVYSVVDLEDGVKKGAISWEDLRREFNSKLEGSSPEFDRAIQACNDLVGSATSLT